MRPTDIIKSIPAGSIVGEVLKIAALMVATILVDKIGEVIKETSAATDITGFIDVKED